MTDLIITRRHLIQAAIPTALVLATTFATPAARAQSKPEVYTTSEVAINGYDAVAYFTDNRAVAGLPQHRVEWKGTTWRFSNAGNKARFAADPELYAPQYGGYCAYAVSQGYTAPTDPDAFSIRNGKLYLNYSLGVRTRWLGNPEGHITAADANWPGVL